MREKDKDNKLKLDFEIEELEERIESVNIAPRTINPDTGGCGTCCYVCAHVPCYTPESCPMSLGIMPRYQPH